MSISFLRSFPEKICFFFSGFSILVFELLGTRILAPFVGSSLYVWTSIIAVIVASLALGYYFGARVLPRAIPKIIIGITVLFLLLSFFSSEVLFFLSTSLDFSNQLSSLVYSIVLLCPVSFLLALLSPALSAKIINESSVDVTKSISSLYIISSVGSVLGTFTTSYLLIPNLSISNILLLLASIWFVIFFIMARSKIYYVIFPLFFFLLFYGNGSADTNYLYEKNTNGGLVQVSDGSNPEEPRSLYIDNLVHSRVHVEDPLFNDDHAQYYGLMHLLNPDVKNVYHIGGGAFSYPRYYSNRFPEKKMTISEINPKLEDIAREYFDFSPNSNIEITNTDGRVFLEETEQVFDSIVVDAFGGYSVPAHLTTLEFISLAFDKTNSVNGSVIMNIPSVASGEGSEFLQSQYLTYKQVFPYVELFLVRDKEKPEMFQSTVLVASKVSLFSNATFTKYLDLLKNSHTLKLDDSAMVLKDDFAPVEYLAKDLEKYFIKKN